MRSITTIKPTMPFHNPSNWEAAKALFEEFPNAEEFAGLDLSEKVTWYDDFLGDALDAKYDVNSGSDPQATDPTITAAVNGEMTLTAGDSNGNFAADGTSWGMELNWQASEGGLVFEARFKIDDITTVAYNIGLSDAKPTGTFEMPFSIGGSDALTSNAGDAVCFVFDTGADTDELFIAGVKGDTDAGPTALGSSNDPVNDTYKTYRIEIADDETATFYLDGTKVGTLASAVTKTVDLTPIIAVQSLTTATRKGTADYVFIQKNRS